SSCSHYRDLPPFPTRRSSDLMRDSLYQAIAAILGEPAASHNAQACTPCSNALRTLHTLDQTTRPTACHPRNSDDFRLNALEEHRSEEPTSELQSRENLVCRLL